jgi:hypothetical protein
MLREKMGCSTCYADCDNKFILSKRHNLRRKSLINDIKHSG